MKKILFLMRLFVLQQELWNHLLTDYKEQQVLVEGPLSHLKESMIVPVRCWYLVWYNWYL